MSNYRTRAGTRPPRHEQFLVLESIYSCFETWGAQLPLTCSKGCSVCCTRDVTLTALEAEYIITFVHKHKNSGFLTEKLAGNMPTHSPPCTGNEYARACLNGNELETGSGLFSGVCPFLENDLCLIYEARPFNCRCFASTETCLKGKSASLPQHYLSAATAISQIIEHLGQGRLWGNMLHLLYLLDNTTTDAPEIEALCRTARPLPGFLLDEQDFQNVEPLLEKLFTTRVAGRTIQAVLNGA